MIAQDMAKQQLGGRLVHVCQGCVVVLQDGSGYGVCVDRSSMTCAVSNDGSGSLYNQLNTTVGLRVVDRAELMLDTPLVEDVTEPLGHQSWATITCQLPRGTIL